MVGRRAGSDIGAAGDVGVSLDDGADQGRDVELRGEPGGQLRIGAEAGRVDQPGDILGIVFGHDADGITGLVVEAGGVRCEFDVPGFAARAGAVEVDDFCDLGAERTLGIEGGFVVYFELTT